MGLLDRFRKKKHDNEPVLTDSNTPNSSIEALEPSINAEFNESTASNVSNASPGVSNVSNVSNTQNKEILDEIKDLRDYIEKNIAKELTVQQLFETLQTHLKVVPKRANLQEMRNINDNHKKILSILATDPSEAYDYQQIAEMTRLSQSGVRSMIHELVKMGYRFKKTNEGRKVKIQLIETLETVK